ncbi:MAG: sigma-70 family RNA polymerase sigma factor [Actinobacteria bacterium]|nr:MAG: sigma-70 family RNA polymerase sigma factor [Actinomycetota bacterium]
MARGKPQERRTNGIHTRVVPLLARRRPAADRSFERLYAKHVHAVYRYSLAVLHNEADAEDVTQTTFLNAYRAFQRGERPHTPHNWLIKIAHNVCRQRFRDSTRRPREVAFDDSLAAATTESADVPTAPEIRRALGFLAFNQRAALVMRELEGRSYAEIADVLDVSLGAVETLIFRGRRALREQLEGGLTCHEAELTLSRLEERKLSNSERGALRAHLRECKDCAVLERRRRGQRAALRNLGAVPLPASLASFFGGGATGGVAVGGLGIGTKMATVLAAGLVVTSVSHEPVTARATAERGATTKHATAQRETAVAGATSQRSLSRRSHTRATSSKRLSATAHSHARRLGTRPTPVSSGSNADPGAPSAGGGGLPPLPVQPPAIQPPALPVQLPPLPLPIQLPPPPPVQLPPPPALPPPPPLP